MKTSTIDLIHYLPYLPIPETIRLKSLGLNLNLHAAYIGVTSNNSLLVQGQVAALNADIKGAAEEQILKFLSLTLDISPSDILARQLNVKKVLMETPQLKLNRDKTGTLSLLTYLPQEQKTLQQEDKTSAEPRQDAFGLNLIDLEIKDATVAFQDFSNEQAFEAMLFPLNIRIKNVTAGDTISGEYSLSLETDIKEALEVSGRFQTHPVQAQGRVALSSLVVNKYVPYYGSFINSQVNDGRVNLSAGFEISEKPDKFDVVIDIPEFEVHSLVMSDPDSQEKMVNIPEFKIKGAVIDMGNRRVDTGVITVRDGKMLVQINKAGEMNLVKTVLPAQEDKKPVTTGMESKSSQVHTPPWAVTMTSFNATGMNVLFNDLTRTDPVTIDLSKISIKADNIKNFGDEKAMVAAEMNWQQEGQISIRGSVTPSTLSAGFDIDLKKIDVNSLQPYFSDVVGIHVTNGSINTKGKLELGNTPEKSIQFAGETSLNNFITLNKQTEKDFFKCASLYLSGLDLSLFPVKVRAKNISLTDFYSRIVVSDTGEINLTTIFDKDRPRDKGSEPEEKKEKIKSEAPRINVESITLQGGHISFSDYLTQPNFTAGMKQIAGSVTGLSSDEQSRAKLVLKGIYGQSSPLDIVGTINPLAQNKFADIAVSFKDIELTNFTPYSSKYLGYKIKKGKLILDLEYKIDKNILTSENRVRFDNLSLGDQVPDKKPTALPLGLAISLLKNREGQIDLDVPVAGALNDPKFKIGNIVLTTLKNLIVKVVTSPFSIIGAMFGGGAELGFVDFEYGETTLVKANYDKLDKLSEIFKGKIIYKAGNTGFL